MENLKIYGIKKVCSMTKKLRGSYDPFYLELFYDTETHKVWVTEHFDIGHNSHTVYNDNSGSIICIGNICYKYKMSEIREMVEEAVELKKAQDEYSKKLNINSEMY